jgi:Uma2 family endonuclease
MINVVVLNSSKAKALDAMANRYKMELKVLEKPKLTPIPRVENCEECIVRLSGISWQRFKDLDACLEGIKSLRLTYVADVLEILTTSSKHEYIKSTLRALLETYMREKGIRYYIRGSFTLMKEGESSGEPDESYCIGSDKEIPDIVLDVIITSGSINKLDVYKPKAVPEMWFWKSNQLRVFHLKPGDYQEVSRSEFFPELDLDWLHEFTQYKDQYDAVQTFQKAIRE